jgi:hypothetical protein
MLGELQAAGSGRHASTLFHSGSVGPTHEHSSAAGTLGSTAFLSQGGGKLLGLGGMHAGAAAASARHKYRLRGVVAHVGTSDSGHYYSFIRTPS